ncbi:MAG TPA: hypothetical protein VJ044_08140, partial [Candidatus Hodarchaeales archaeon]|nr:hypothetical protein [Candidatus Hodarchaeales archaeon]
IHYPTNNSLIWDCMKTIDRLLKKLKETGVEIKVRTYKKQAKKTYTRSTTRNLKRSGKRNSRNNSSCFGAVSIRPSVH